jgi:hypothetical protein
MHDFCREVEDGGAGVDDDCGGCDADVSDWFDDDHQPSQGGTRRVEHPVKRGLRLSYLHRDITKRKKKKRFQKLTTSQVLVMHISPMTLAAVHTPACRATLVYIDCN